MINYVNVLPDANAYLSGNMDLTVNLKNAIKSVLISNLKLNTHEIVRCAVVCCFVKIFKSQSQVPSSPNPLARNNSLAIERISN